MFDLSGINVGGEAVEKINEKAKAANLENVQKSLIEGENANGGQEKTDSALVKHAKHHIVEKRVNDKAGNKKKNKKQKLEDNE